MLITVGLRSIIWTVKIQMSRLVSVDSTLVISLSILYVLSSNFGQLWLVHLVALYGEQSLTHYAEQVPILDGSAQEWVEAVDKVGLKVAVDIDGNNYEKMVPHLIEPVQILRKDSFVAAFPSPKVHLSCGIDFSEVHLNNLAI